MTAEELQRLGEDISLYCKKFNVPLGYLFEILEDQKVTPMIRGKAMEYNAYLHLDNLLPKAAWSVQKLNLNAQANAHDEDVSITHRRTGTILKVESKSAVRGSMSLGSRSRGVFKNVPHFKVKSHRSRSSLALANTSNDRYPVDCFDVIITNTTNAVFQGNTVSEVLEILYDSHIRSFLQEFYHIESDEDLVAKCEKDWRFVIPSDISENGFIPRTPYVRMNGDANWRPTSDLETRLLQVVEERRNTQVISRRS